MGSISNRDRAKLVGVLVHFVNGWIFSLIYVAAFHTLFNRATNAPYRVLNGNTVLGAQDINQELAPDEFADFGVGWEIMGVFNISAGSLAVELSNNPTEYVIADAVEIIRVG